MWMDEDFCLYFLLVFFVNGPGVTMTQEEVTGFGDLFQDPEGYYQPEKESTQAEHRMHSGQTVRVQLVGSHPLYVRLSIIC